MKKAVLVVSFGTSHNDTREKTIDRIESALDIAFPDRILYRAWTSGKIIRKVNERDGAGILTVSEAMQRMKADGIDDILVQPTHILNGIENEIMKDEIRSLSDGFASVSFGEPLLSSDEDLESIVAILADKYENVGSDTAVVFMGHGTTHYVNPVYAALDYRFKDAGHSNFYIGTVEAFPTVESVLRMVREHSEIRRVILAPLMIVAGDHAKNDMSGHGEESWQTIFTSAGYEVTCNIVGLGEYNEIASMFVMHSRQAEKNEKSFGQLIGIGAGPGDPDLVTIKALKKLQDCDVIAVPDADKGTSTVYQILRQAYPEIEVKPCFTLVMPMTHDLAKLAENYRAAADTVESFLRQGKTVGFITLGDPTVYSTYMYVHQLVLADGFKAEIVPGITSFCAAAARLNISLAERSEMMHVVPSSHGIESALEMPGTKVLMKAGSKMGTVKDTLLKKGMNAKMVENCGMPNEKIYLSAEEIPENAGYFSLIIAKDKKD